MQRAEIEDYRYPQGWADQNTADARSRQACRWLEEGKIVYFPHTPFNLPQDDREFLLSQKQSTFKGHKNISYRPANDMLRGAAGESPQAIEQLHAVMRRFSQEATRFLADFLRPYADHWKLDFASYRPLEEQNRNLPTHKRNDLMHVDAFPSRPTHGGRILRCFVNINPSRGRVWETTDGFETLAKNFAEDAGLKKFAAGVSSPIRRPLKKLAPIFRAVGIKGVDRSAYDRFMLRFHDYLKDNNDYQQKWTKYRLEFPPGACWMVYTDQVPHAVISGQFAMEQTYIIPLSAMVEPQLAPAKVLERICGTALIEA